MEKKQGILKETPEYEDYDVNEAKLSVQELRELGIIKCGGCKSSGRSRCMHGCFGMCTGKTCEENHGDT